MFVVTLLLLAGVANAFQAPRALTTKRYDGYKVISLVPSDPAVVAVLRDWLVNNIHVDFWQEPSRIGRKVSFMVAPEHVSHIVTELRKTGATYEIEHDNVQDLLTPMWNSMDKQRMESKAFDLNQFNTLDDIYSWMDSLAVSCRNGLTCEVYSVGRSYEGQEIKVFKISKSGTGRRGYWIDSTIHAREWIATSTNLNILYRLATGLQATQPEAYRLTEAFDWYIMPVMNPDGYTYTFTNDRMWRKNRAVNSGSPCIGTDLNRNFNFRWGQEGVSHLPCSETYCGASGGSEPETQATSAELNRVGSTLNAMVTIHSYGNMWMFPWGNTVNHQGQVCDLADDHDDMMAVANAAADAIENTYNTRWDRGNSCVVIYQTTGGTDDYAKGVAGVKYSFCPELRGNNFIINENQIPPAFEEVWNGIVAMSDAISPP